MPSTYHFFILCLLALGGTQSVRVDGFSSTPSAALSVTFKGARRTTESAASGLCLVQRGALAARRENKSTSRGGPLSTLPWAGVLAHRTRVFAVEIQDTVSLMGFAGQGSSSLSTSSGAAAATSSIRGVGGNDGSSGDVDGSTKPTDAGGALARERQVVKEADVEAAQGVDCDDGRLCLCGGFARFFDGQHWTKLQALRGPFVCSAETFGVDKASAGAVDETGGGVRCGCLPSVEQASAPPDATAVPLLVASPGGTRTGQPEGVELAVPRVTSLGGGRPPVSPVAASAMAVTLAYFVAAVGLASVRTWNRAMLRPRGLTELILESTVGAVGFAPMLCTVYLAVTKRAETLSGGKQDAYHMPPLLVRLAVVVSAVAFCLHAVFWLLGDCAATSATTSVPVAGPVTPVSDAAATPSGAAAALLEANAAPRVVPPQRPVPACRSAAAASGSSGAGVGSGGTNDLESGGDADADADAGHAAASELHTAGGGRPSPPPRPVPAERRGVPAVPELALPVSKGGEEGAPGASDQGLSGHVGGAESAEKGDASATTQNAVDCRRAREASRLYYWLSHACVGVMHWSLVIVFIGVTIMTAPEPVKAERGTQRMAAGTVCTLVLAVPYFATHLVQHAAQCATASPLSSALQGGDFEAADAGDLAEARAGWILVEQVARLAATALGLAPMLCVLFLGTQLLHDWAVEAGLEESPRAGDYVDVSMYTCTAASLAQFGLSIAGPLAAGVEVRSVRGGGYEIVTSNRTAFRLVAFLRFIVMTSLYAGVEIVCGSLSNSKAPVHPLTKLLLPLVGIYFLTYAIQWLLISIRDVTDVAFNRSLRVLRGAKDLVSLCPMLAVLLLEAWVRARHVSSEEADRGTPLAYARSSMVVAVGAFFVQLLALILSGIFARSTISSATSGAALQKRDPIALLLFVLFHAATLVMCVSIGSIACSLFDVTA